ncbi:MAG: hypothetical protein MPJ24_11585, partial [Pirellulaceae bacterium]|nr:hypothetical protein [Pirellulaceae bacterium]
PKGEAPLDFLFMADLLERVGINWVKFPVWHNYEKREEWAGKLARFVERLSSKHINFVAMLDEPPKDSRSMFGASEEDRMMEVASVFEERELWQKVVDPVMPRMSLNVRYWQLGSDDDVSFVGYPNLKAKISEIKQHLQRFGQEIRIGVGWRWLNEDPDTENVPWTFLSYRVEVPFTGQELADYLKSRERGDALLWVVVNPLPKSKYTLEERALDLVQRMIACRIQKADAAYIPRPFNNENGLMNEDGTPGELLLPWRTTSLMLSGTRYIGKLQLPSGSENEVFIRGDEAIMVVWNNKHDVQEEIFLGQEIKQHDLWGRVATPKTKEHRQVIQVGKLPTFVTGLDPRIARWRMQFQFDRNAIKSIYGQKQVSNFRFSNSFPRGISGSMNIQTPDVWDVSRARTRFKLVQDETKQSSFEILLKAEANSGPQPVRIDFETSDIQFSVYRTLNVGLGEVTMEVTTNINERGQLVIEQHIFNHTDDFVSFQCILSAPGRRRKRQRVLDIGRGRHTLTYTLPRGEELEGATIFLRAEETGGYRVLNYPIVIE